MPRRCDQTLGAPVTRWELAPTIPPVGMLTANIQNIFNMNIDELNSFLQSLPGELLDDASQIVSETAQEYFKDTFRLKAFDGNPWTPARHPKSTGSLLVNSSALLNSIRPAVVTPERVVISAGNDKVTYAAAHNEGYRGPVDVRAHQRTVKKTGTVYDVRAHTRMTDIVQRRFMGDSAELNDMIHGRIEGHIESVL